MRNVIFPFLNRCYYTNDQNSLAFFIKSLVDHYASGILYFNFMFLQGCFAFKGKKKTANSGLHVFMYDLVLAFAFSQFTTPAYKNPYHIYLCIINFTYEGLQNCKLILRLALVVYIH